MNLSQLFGRYGRLKRELAVAYSSLPWNGAWIDRLSRDLAETEREIMTLQPTDEPVSEFATALER